MTKQCWIIVGATSAIAQAFAQLMAKKNHDLILLARDEEKLITIKNDLTTRYAITVHIMLFDAMKCDQHESLAKSCHALTPHPIRLFVAFGVMKAAPAISHSVKEVVDVIQTNFVGVASIIFSFVPYFQQQQSGHIIVLGSVAGDRGRPANFDYGAAKAALVSFCEGLSASLANDHVNVTLMKLGYIDTPMSFGKTGMFLAASPQACAMACYRAALKKKSISYFPAFWWWIMLIFKRIPIFLLRRLKV